MALITAMLAVGLLAAVGAIGMTADKRGWFAEVASDMGPISIDEARESPIDNRIDTAKRFMGKNIQYILVLTIAGTIVLAEVAFLVLSEITLALLIGAYSAGLVTYEHREEIWNTISAAGYILKEGVEFLAALLTIASAGLLGAVYQVILNWLK